MNLLIVANGDVNNISWYDFIIKEADQVIAVDGGADNCIKLGVTPDYIIGDLDSISLEAKTKFEKKSRLIYDGDQNKTDMQLAINLSNSLKPEKIIFTGTIGNRIDHTIANIFSLAHAKADSKIVDEYNEVYFVKKNLELSGKKGDLVSILSVSDVQGLTYEGLKWNLNKADVPSGWIGICNEMIEEKAKISLAYGKIIVIKPRD